MLLYGNIGGRKEEEKELVGRDCFVFFLFFLFSFLFLCFCLLNLNKVLPYIVFLLLGFFSFLFSFLFSLLKNNSDGQVDIIGSLGYHQPRYFLFGLSLSDSIEAFDTVLFYNYLVV